METLGYFCFGRCPLCCGETNGARVITLRLKEDRDRACTCGYARAGGWKERMGYRLLLLLSPFPAVHEPRCCTSCRDSALPKRATSLSKIFRGPNGSDHPAGPLRCPPFCTPDPVPAVFSSALHPRVPCLLRSSLLLTVSTACGTAKEGVPGAQAWLSGAYERGKRG